MSRTLAIDYGEKRIGLAISDTTGTVATPFSVLQASDQVAVLREIVTIVNDRKVDHLVVGLPLRMDGTRGPAALKALDFVRKLEQCVSVPVDTWDERFSTVSAQSALIEGGTRRNKRKQVVDKLAAQIFLQHYLDAQAGLPPIPEDD